jgi:TetR/AcrR family transcriptional regulator, cholesterol catabolism regulator
MAMTSPAASNQGDADAILDVVLHLLEDRGEDGLQLRQVAKEARVSLSTVYKYFPSRDELVIAAVERWMAEHVYSALPVVSPEERLADRLTRWFGQLLAPWVEQPDMLRIFIGAALLPGGQRLARQGEQLAGATAVHLFDGCEPKLAVDIAMVLTNVIQGLLSRFAIGNIGIGELTDELERTIHLLADGVEARAAGERVPR